MQHTGQQQVTGYAVRRYEVDNGLGDRVTTSKNSTDLRVFLQNPNGVMGKKQQNDDRRALTSMREWDVDIIALPETNKNWAQEWIRNKWKREVKSVWPHAKVYCTSMDEPVHKHAEYVQGGACLIITNSWSSRVMANGCDHLGRWVWVTLRGRSSERLTVTAMYCPNPGYPTDGPATVWSQQRTRLQELALERGDPGEVDPREKCLYDFERWIKARKEQGERVVVLTDANQTTKEDTMAYSLKELISNNQLRAVLDETYPGKVLRSVDRGSKTNDHILTSGVGEGSIKRVGQLPFGLGFDTDHRAVFADFCAKDLLRIHMEEPEKRESRRLSSANKKQRDKYIESLQAEIKNQNIFKQVGNLGKKSMQGELDRR